MNRPSRTDETTDHPTWNQNPPFLAPDLTTREDLNGTANDREHRRGTGTASDSLSGLAATNYRPLQEFATPPNRNGGRAGSRSGEQKSIGFCSPSKETATSAPAVLSASAPSRSPVGRRSKAVLGWITWGLSVIAASVLLNKLSELLSVSDSHVFLNVAEPTTSWHGSSAIDIAPSNASALSSPLRKRSTCGSGGPSEDNYNTSLHVGALVIILVVSGLACAFTLIMKKLPNFKIPVNFFFTVRHFGTGVLIATAFVHLLPTAFTYLGDPCLSSFWIEDYPAMPGAIALAGIFLVTVIEMVFSPHRRLGQASETTTSPSDAARENEDAIGDSDIEMAQTCTRAAAGPSGDMGPLRGRSLSISRQLSRVEALPHQSSVDKSGMDVEGSSIGPAKLSPEQQHKKDILQCMLLEMGILFHSVFIGMALAVSTGKEFIVLLIAIVFHQSFEGLALGARIASIDWPDRTWQPWLMAFAYGCTTPVGQAIGIGVHSLYDPESEFGLVLVGTMNAISSGLLVFASLVELLSEDFLTDESWRVLKGKRRVLACLLVLAGAFGMSLVGAWA